MRPKILLIVLSAVVIGGILLIKGTIRSKPELKNQQTEIMKKILAECSPLGSPTDQKVRECEEKIRSVN